MSQTVLLSGQRSTQKTVEEAEDFLSIQAAQSDLSNSFYSDNQYYLFFINLSSGVKVYCIHVHHLCVRTEGFCLCTYST